MQIRVEQVSTDLGETRPRFDQNRLVFDRKWTDADETWCDVCQNSSTQVDDTSWLSSAEQVRFAERPNGKWTRGIHILAKSGLLGRQVPPAWRDETPIALLGPPRSRQSEFIRDLGGLLRTPNSRTWMEHAGTRRQAQGSTVPKLGLIAWIWANIGPLGIACPDEARYDTAPSAPRLFRFLSKVEESKAKIERLEEAGILKETSSPNL